jgi:RNA polymerase sigma factor (sigma-70 family)
MSSSSSGSSLSSGRDVTTAEGSARWSHQLVVDAQRGDVLAMDALLERLLPLVMSICRRLAGTEAEDAAQDTLLIVFRHLRDLKRPEALASWVSTIARREAVRHARARSSDPLPDEVPVAQSTDRLELREALGALTVPQREVLVLRDLNGLTETETASVLALPRGTVKSRLHRARRALWEALQT